MKNINDFVAWYADKYNKPLPSVTSSAQVERTDKIKNHILSGLAAGGVLTFPNVTGEVTDVRISVPSQYTLSINGYQTRQLSVTEYQVLVSGTQPQLTLQYQLGVASPQQLNVLSPAVVQAVVTTSEKADIAVAKEKIEEVSVADASTDTSIDKSTSPDATNGSTTPTPAVPKTETKVTTVYEPESKEFKREYSASSTLFPYESYAGDSESATLFADIHGYLELAAIVQTIFGTDLRQSFDASVAGKNGLLNSADMESLKTILGLAYALQHTKGMRGSENGERVSWSNAIVPMSVLSGVAVISGLMIFAIMGSKLDVIGSQFITLMMAGVVLLLVFSYSNNLLLKYFKHIGFLVSIGLLMLYIISASQLFDVQFATTNQGIASVSPLTYTEKMFQLLLSHQEGWGLIFGILLFLIPALGGLNVYLYKEMED